MGRRKLDKFRDNEIRNNVIQPGKPAFGNLKGRWKEIQFKNNNPLILELACGKGDYTVGLGKLFPDKNFIGIDIKGSRIWTGSTVAENEGLSNVAFLRIHILNLEDHFSGNEADAIWITFPDPHPKKSDTRQRLTHPRFLTLYRKVLKPGGWVHLKTDNDGLFHYTLETLRSSGEITGLDFSDDLYHSELMADHFGLMTDYEKRFLEEGLKIKYLKFRFSIDP